MEPSHPVFLNQTLLSRDCWVQTRHATVGHYIICRASPSHIFCIEDRIVRAKESGGHGSKSALVDPEVQTAKSRKETQSAAYYQQFPASDPDKVIREHARTTTTASNFIHLAARFKCSS